MGLTKSKRLRKEFVKVQSAESENRRLIGEILEQFGYEGYVIYGKEYKLGHKIYCVGNCGDDIKIISTHEEFIGAMINKNLYSDNPEICTFNILYPEDLQAVLEGRSKENPIFVIYPKDNEEAAFYFINHVVDINDVIQF